MKDMPHLDSAQLNYYVIVIRQNTEQYCSSSHFFFRFLWQLTLTLTTRTFAEIVVILRPKSFYYSPLQVWAKACAGATISSMGIAKFVRRSIPISMPRL